MKTNLIFLASILLFTTSSNAQNVGVGTTTPAAKLDITSTNSGILIPRIALTGSNDVTTVPGPVTSTMIYNTATVAGGNAITPGFYYWNGTVWTRVIDAAATPTNIYTADGTLTAARTVTMGANNLTFSSTTGNVVINGNNFLSTGTFGTGTIPTTGAGTRMMWYPSKAAFRVGSVSSAQWDDGNIGQYSTAMGYNTNATGQYSTAMGSGSTASGTFSTAMGLSTASGQYSTAMGNSVASTMGSTAMGVSTASGLYSTAMGYATTASGQYSTAMGYATTASGLFSTAMGYNCTASGLYSTATGYSSTAGGNNSTALGNSTSARSYVETSLGLFNTTYSPASTSAWVGTDRLFGIGNGTSSGATSDAIVILKNGNTGIGTATPTNKLEVVGNTKTTNFQMTASPTAGYIMQTDASGNGAWVAPSTITTGTTHTLTNTTNTITSTVNGVTATAPAVNTVSNTSSANTILTTVNGVAGATVPIINSNTLTSATNTITSTVNGVTATAPAVNAVSNTSSANTILTTVNGIAGATVPIINSHTLTSATNTITSTVNGVTATAPAVNTDLLTLSGTSITSTVNGVASTPLDISAIDKNIYNSDGTLTGARTVTMSGNTLGLTGGNVGIGTTTPSSALQVVGKTSTTNFQMTTTPTAGYIMQSDASGNGTWVAPPTISTATTNTLTNTTNTITSTVNGVTATAPAVTTDLLTLSGTTITSTVNGMASTPLDISPITATDWKITGNNNIVDGTNFIGTTNNVALTFIVNNIQAGRLDNALQNAFYGVGAGHVGTTGSYNTAMGYNSFLANTTGNYNAANGAFALGANTTGISNTATGANSMLNNTTGNYNTSNGFQAFFNNTTGYANTANGDSSMASNTTGHQNTGNGYNALLHNTTGSNNTALGYKADVASAALVNATAIGANAQAGNSNTVILGSINGVNGATASVNVGIGTTTPSTPFEVFTNAPASTYIEVGSFLSPNNTAAGDGTMIRVGSSATTNNAAQFRFYTGASGGTTNYAQIGIYGYGTGPAVLPSGFVGIGTTTPSSALQVVGKISTTNFQMTTTPTAGYILQSDASGNGTWVAPPTISSATTNTLTNTTNTITSTVNSVTATAPAVNAVSNTSSANTILTTVNGVAGATVPIINSYALTNTTNTITSTVNGVTATAPAVNAVSNTSSANTILTTVNGVAGATVPIINSYTLTSASNTITSTVNGVTATAPAVNAVSNTSSANTILTTVNGVAGATVPIINSHTLTSATNTLTSTVNGVTATAPAVNTDVLSLSGTTITSTVNGVASTPLDISAIDNNIYNTNGTLTAARTVTMAGNTLSFTGGNVGIGTTIPSTPFEVFTNAPASVYVEVGSFLSPNNTAAGDGTMIRVGSSATTNNAAQFRFYTGASGGTTNYAQMGIYGYATGPAVLPSGFVGIGTTTPSSALQVVGKTATTNLQMTNGATANYILQSDASGNGSWVNPNTIAANNIYNSNGSLTAARTVTMAGFALNFTGGNVGIGAPSPSATLEVNGTAKVDGLAASTAGTRVVTADAAGNLYGAALKATQEYNQTSYTALGSGIVFSCSGGTLILMCSGSGYSTSVAATIGANILIDGVVKGSLGTYTNEANSHKAFTSNSIVVTGIASGSHTVTIALKSGTTCDMNDFFSVTSLELPY